ncbi:UNVERIFIED_CONTAM: hypothetical protein FKN15_026605 [Acipenser sinensis]
METSQTAESREFQYLAKRSSAQARKQHKLSVLRENLECLYTYYSGTGDKMKKSNLIFYTEHLNAWHTAVCKKYSDVTHEAAEIEKTYTTSDDPKNTDPEDSAPSSDSTTPDTNLHTPTTPTTPSDIQHTWECLALLELEFVEFKARPGSRKPASPSSSEMR